MNRKIEWKGLFANWKVRLGIFAVSMVLVGAATQFAMNYFMKQKVQIAEAFMDSDVITSKSSIEMAGQYKTKSLTKREKEAVIRCIADRIGLKVDDEFQYVQNEKSNEVYVERTSKDAATQIKLVSINANKEGEIPVIHNYLMVHMDVFDHIDSIMDYKKLIKKAMDELKVSNESAYVEFAGKYPGQLSIKTKDRITNQMLNNLNGKVTYENRKDEMYTVYGYSGGLDEYISVGQGKVNIQVAMDYDEGKDETVVYLATPILNGSY